MLQKLLSNDGAIFISIDDNEQANLKLICDEIFGAGNFVANVVWRNCDNSNNDAKQFSNDNNFTLVYSKVPMWNPNKILDSNKHSHFKNPDNDPRGPYFDGNPLNSPNPRENLKYPIIAPNGNVINPPSNGWRWSKETLYDKIKTGEIFFTKDYKNIKRRTYLADLDGLPPSTLWIDLEQTGSTRKAKYELKKIFSEKISSELFPTPKPYQLIEYVLKLATDKDSIILDSFAGSGTTAHAVLNLNKADGGNRKFILVEMEDYAESITAERVKRVIKGYGDTEGTGGSFDFYELGEPVFDEDKNLNENIGEEKIREYIWFSETHIGLQAARLSNADEPSAIQDRYFLGKYNNCGYWFFYQKETETTLDDDFLKTMSVECEQYVIYADKCILPKDFMNAKNIVFKKIPRDIKKL